MFALLTANVTSAALSAVSMLIVLIQDHVKRNCYGILRFEDYISKKQSYILDYHYKITLYRMKFIKEYLKYFHIMSYWFSSKVRIIYSSIIYYSIFINAYGWYRILFLNRTPFEQILTMIAQIATYFIIFSLLLSLIFMLNSFNWIKHRFSWIVFQINFNNSPLVKLKYHAFYARLMSCKYDGIRLYPNWKITPFSLITFISLYTFFMTNVFNIMKRQR